MDVNAPGGVLRAFGDMEDPRSSLGRRHKLVDMIVIALCAIICGADDWCEIAFFGRDRKRWLEGFLELPHGIPSHDTFGRVFAMLDPMAFELCFRQFMGHLAGVSKGRLVAVDGKTLRGSFDTAAGKAAIDMVSAWCAGNQTVLAQFTCSDKSNEITAMPKLLELLDLQGAIVTADAMHCQKETAGAIIDRGAHYLLQVKGNQGQLHQDMTMLFEQCMREDCHGVAHAYIEEVEKNHGRIETRRCWTCWDTQWFSQRQLWKELSSFVCIETLRQVGVQTSRERHYYISSLEGRDPKRMLELARGHWSIENQLHRTLDVTFMEDGHRLRKGHGAENFSRLSRMALNLLKADKSHKGASMKVKRKLGGWNQDYLLHLLTLAP